MKIQAGQTVLLTGASGGIGVHLARALAARGVNLMLVAYPGIDLGEVQASAEKQGVKCLSRALDLSKAEQRQEAIAATKREFGGLDIIVNNAGVEYSSVYHELSHRQIQEMLAVNLEAPMLLAHLALPDMLRQGRGHIVNISSLAGKSGPAYQETYAATKAGLVGFSMSLRATYRKQGVSASVITPGFVEAGIYSRLKEKAGRPAPLFLGAVSPEAVARAMLRSIEADKAEIVVNRHPIVPLLVLIAISPGAGAWVVDKMGANDFFRTVVEAEKQERK